MGTFSTSLSGLDAEEQALSVISNDLSNLNTTAFKSGTPVFSDLFFQMLGTDGAGDPVQVGVGATMSSVSSPMTQGTITTTGVPTDVAIQGNGLFVLDQGSTQVYSRAGNFLTNTQGNLVDSNGNNVMGYSAVNGVINTSQALAPIVISSGQTFPPNATSTVQLDMNLDATDTTLAPATGTLTVPQPLPTPGQTVSIGGTTYTFESNITTQSAAGSVLIGADAASTLANLASAINLGSGKGATYATSTGTNGVVTATGSTATTLSLQAINAGAEGNSDGTATNWTGESFASGDLSGGVTAQTASATFIAPSTQPENDQTIDIDGTTYTFVQSLDASTANEVLIDSSSVTNTLSNLVAAMSNSGTGSGYESVAAANPVTAELNQADGTITLTAPASGSAGNGIALTADWGSFAVSNLTGGATGVPATATLTLPAGAAAPTPGQTVTIGGTTYTFENSITTQSSANNVLIGGSAQTALAHLVEAIGKGANEGTDYATGTVQNPDITVSASTDTAATLQATPTGTGNATPVSTNWAGVLFAGGDLAGGVNGQLAAGSLTVNQPLPTAGETVAIGGTTYTFVTKVADLSAANTVLIDPNASMLNTMANLAGAINATSGGGQSQGGTYGTGTVPNTSVTATGSNETTVSLQALQSGSGGNTIPTTTTWTAGSFGAGDLTGGTDAGTYSTDVNVYDSLGNSHVLTFNFTKSSAGNWAYRITIPAADVGQTGSPEVVGSGTLQFGANGTLVSPPADVQGITVPGLADGAKTISFNWQLFSSPGTGVITQTAEPSAASGQTQDGYSAGTLQSYSIDSSGVIDGVLSNGQTVALGQIALATFANYDGLTNLGSNDYQTSLASGAASVAAPGTGGSGTLDGGSLEASNVDIATAFTMLIQAERGYEANAKAITTADDVMQASINLIQS
ncbi:MAG: flagellar hook-basal body complex protein [Terriglobia bacterium]